MGITAVAVFQEKAVFQQYAVIRLQIELGKCSANKVKRRESFLVLCFRRVSYRYLTLFLRTLKRPSFLIFRSILFGDLLKVMWNRF